MLPVWGAGLVFGGAYFGILRYILYLFLRVQPWIQRTMRGERPCILQQVTVHQAWLTY